MRTFQNLIATSAAVALGAMAYPAGAQDVSTETTAAIPADLVELDDDAAVMVAPFDIDIVELEELEIFGPDGNEIGEVEEVLGDASGTPAAVAVDFDDGFLGIGDTEAVVSLDLLSFEDGRLVTALTAEEAEALPQWDD